MSIRLYDITLDFSNYLGENKIYTYNFYDKETLNFIINELLDLDSQTKNNIRENPPVFSCNGRILNSKLSLRDNKIFSGDKILICSPKLKTESKLPLLDENPTTINSSETTLIKNKKSLPLKKEIKEEKEKKSFCLIAKIFFCKNKKWLIPLIIFCFICLGGGIYLSLKLDEKKEKYLDEKLISKLDYKINQVYNLLNIKDIRTFVEPKKMKDLPYKNKTFNISEYTHYTFCIENENIEFDKNHKIKRKYYNGFLSINNITFENETDIMMNLYLNNFNESYISLLEEYNKNINKEKQIIVNINNETNFTQPIIKFDFYKNGKIKEIYIPNNLGDYLFTSLYEFLNNFIPRINVGCDNITKELEKIKEEEREEEEEEVIEEEYNDDLEEEEEDEEKTLRRLNDKKKIITKYKIKVIEKLDTDEKRRLNHNIDLDLNKSAYTIDSDIKEIEYIDTSEEKNEKEIDLREYQSFNSTNNNSNINNSVTFINQYKQGLAGKEEQSLKNSSKIIWSNIEIDDNLGIIKLININTSVELNDYLVDDENQENKDENNLKDIINENYLNSAEDNTDKYQENNNTENIDSNIESSFNQLKYITNESIIIKDNYININNKIVIKLKDYFNKYNYRLYS